MRVAPLPPSRWLHRFTVAVALCTLALIGVGGLVTSKGAGLAVPDWPNTYGYNMFLFPVSQWVGGVLYEHSHRLVASVVGLLVAILAAWLWGRETSGRIRGLGWAAILAVLVLMGVRRLPVYLGLACAAPVAIGWAAWRLRREPGQLRWWGVMALAGVIAQGVLGGLRVVWLEDQIGILHGTLAQLFLLLMCALALFTSAAWARGNWPFAEGVSGIASRVRTLRWVLPGTTVLILLQLVLGASMRHQHAGLAIPDFPLAYGRLWPATDAEAVARYNQRRVEVVAAKPITAGQIHLQMTHRLTAMLIAAAVLWCVVLARQGFGSSHLMARLTLGWLGLIAVQILLGAWTIWSDKAADVATLHVLVGALALACGGLCSLVLRRAMVASAAAETTPSRHPSNPCLTGRTPARSLVT